MQQARNRLYLVIGLIAFGIAMRVLPYVLARMELVSLTDPLTFAWNVSPVGALCLLFAAYLPRGSRGGIALGLMALLASDVLIALVTGYWQYAFYKTMPFVYVGLVIQYFIGTTLQDRIQPMRLAGTVVVSELAFWLFTNFGEWVAGDMNYAKTPTGMLLCYASALPYLYRSLYGSLIYSAIFFGGAHVLDTQSSTKLVPVPIPSEPRR